MTQNKSRILFICKIRNDFYGPSFGLINSCRFIACALEEHGIPAKVVTVVDNNDIDREVSNYKPTHVFIESLWVVPEKFEELIPLHPTVQWYVRIHSKIPFLANEGMAMEWLRKYDELSVYYHTLHIASNSDEVVEEFAEAYNINVLYFPNIYCPEESLIPKLAKPVDGKSQIIDIGCFGAIRPMKNQLNQALAAITFGNESNSRINFHINSDRCELKGDAVLRNLVYAFKDTPHKLVFHPWMDHKDFIPLVQTMDLGMQVSMSETFNIVAADFVWNGVPLIGSDEITWLDRHYKADPNSLEDMVDKLRFAYAGKKHNIQKANLDGLVKYNNKSTKVWLDAL